MNRTYFALLAPVAAGFLAAPLLAEPTPWPGGTSYSEDFDAPEGLGPQWTLSSWVVDGVWPSGATEITGTSGWAAAPFVLFSPPGDPNPEPVLDPPISYPLPAKQAADSYLNYGFAANWLITAAGRTNAAKIEFTGLPAHAAINLDMLLAAGGSIDGDDVASPEPPSDPLSTGNLIIRVDGVEAFSWKLAGSADGLASQGAIKLVQGNVNPYLYMEHWDAPPAEGEPETRTEASRSWVSWATSAGYDLTAMTALDAIPHTSDTLTLEFIHGFDGPSQDEHIAIDKLKLSLNAAPPPDPVLQFPAEGTYKQEFSNPVLGAEWTLEGWAQQPVWPSGATQVTGTSGWIAAPFVIQDGANPNLAPAGTSYPLPAVEPADSYLNYGFANNWLVSVGGRNLAAKVRFKELPPHSAIDLDMLLAAGGSIDGDDVLPDPLTGSFAVLVDGSMVWSTPGGVTDPQAVRLLQSTVNPNVYIEAWNAPPVEGPDTRTTDDRTWQNWTTSSGWDLGWVDALSNIPHTASTLTVEFVHGLDSNNSDEHVALENFAVQLINAQGPIGCGNGDRYDEWVCSRFTPAERADPAVSGPDANPDGDRFVNLLEYAFGLDPKQTSPADRAPDFKWVTVKDQNYGSLAYRRATLPSDLTFVLETSTDLQSWTNDSAATSYRGTGVPVQQSDGTTTVVVRDTQNYNPEFAHRYYRLSVALLTLP